MEPVELKIKAEKWFGIKLKWNYCLKEYFINLYESNIDKSKNKFETNVINVIELKNSLEVRWAAHKFNK